MVKKSILALFNINPMRYTFSIVSRIRPTTYFSFTVYFNEKTVYLVDMNVWNILPWRDCSLTIAECSPTGKPSEFFLIFLRCSLWILSLWAKPVSSSDRVAPAGVMSGAYRAFFIKLGDWRVMDAATFWAFYLKGLRHLFLVTFGRRFGQ